MNAKNLLATIHEAAATGERHGLATVTWEQMPPENAVLGLG
jgi:hypothetical protein